MHGTTKHTGGDRLWVADLHLGHAKVADLRGFASVREHDTHILSQLAELDPWDTLWVLGDISSGKPEDERIALALLDQMVNAEMHLIAGNHDSVSSIHRRGFKKQREWLEVFDSVQQLGRVRINGQGVMMSHYPYARSGDGPGRGPGRYNEYRLPDMGLPLIHGHTHHYNPHMEIRTPPAAGGVYYASNLLDLSQFCVSWDANRGPVDEARLSTWVVDWREGREIRARAE